MPLLRFSQKSEIIFAIFCRLTIIASGFPLTKRPTRTPKRFANPRTPPWLSSRPLTCKRPSSLPSSPRMSSTASTPTSSTIGSGRRQSPTEVSLGPGIRMKSQCQHMKIGRLNKQVRKFKNILKSEKYFPEFNLHIMNVFFPSGYGCSPSGCSKSLDAMFVKASSSFSWEVAPKTELKGYVCSAKCKRGFIWYSSLQKCIRVVNKYNQKM